jgi:hypothetical protein
MARGTDDTQNKRLSHVEDEDSDDDSFDDMDSDEYYEDEDEWHQKLRERIVRHQQHDRFLFNVLLVAIVASSAAGFIIDYCLWRRITKGGGGGSTSDEMQKQILAFVLKLLSDKLQQGGDSIAIPPAPEKNEPDWMPSSSSTTKKNQLDAATMNKLQDTAIHETWIVRRDLYGKVTGAKKQSEYVG